MESIKEDSQMNKSASAKINTIGYGQEQTRQRLPLQVVREIRDIDSDSHSLELRFRLERAIDGSHWKTIVVPCSMAMGANLRPLQDKLLNKGAHRVLGGTRALELIKQAVGQSVVRIMIQETGHTGWHGDSFVWQGGTHGPLHGKLRFRTDEAVDQAELTHGTLEAWRSGFETPCQRSKILVFALAMGFGAPFLKLVSPNGGATFYTWGETTTGKTLASRAEMSIFRRAEERDLMTFDHTDRTLDEEAAAYNDLVLVLNESEYLDDSPDVLAASMRKIAYKIAGGVGRQRSKTATRINPDLENKKWRTLCLGSGETTAVRPGRKGGEKIRLVDIPVPKPHLGGIFDEHDSDVSDPVVAGYEMAQAVERTILENYGVAFAPFMEKVCADHDETTKRVKRNVSLFVKNVVPGADAKTRRMVEKFGIIYAGAIEACRFGVAPWTEQRARVAIAHVCRLALKRIAVESTVESAIKKLRAAVQNSQRFPIIEKGQSLPSNLVGHAMGFRRSGTTGKFVAVGPEDLKTINGGREIAEKVLKQLVDEGILWMDGDKRVRKVQVQGFGDATRPHWYCFWYNELINRRSAKSAVPSV